MLATALKWQPRIRQVQGDTPAILSQIVEDDVNLAVWQRQLPAHIEDFGALLLSLNEPLAEAITLEISDDDFQPDLQNFASAYADLEGYAGFIADVSWLISAYACLLGAKRIGVRLRVLDKAMCPRFHVDHVSVRLITTYAGIGSQWLREGAIDRSQLGNPQAEPLDALKIKQINCGDVALLKGERWVGNEGQGLVHRSPRLQRDERRLLLTLDWLA
jgi:hypothetical protein